MSDGSSSALQVVQSLAPENGGTSIAVPSLAIATAATGRYNETVIHFGPSVSVGHLLNVTTLQQSCPGVGLLFPTPGRSLLRQAVRAADIVQIHGIWTAHSKATIQLSARARKPVILSAHGMLDDWALNHKGMKKLVYSALVERPSLSRASCLRALTRVEADNYRTYGLKSPVAIVPNGMAAPSLISPAEFFARHPELEGRKIALFMGRLHKKKGIDLLLQAWNAVSPQLPGAHLVIAGPDDGPLGASIRKAAATVKSITICGMLAGSIKWSALSAAAAFVLPSLSEGLSIAILEAMFLGLPVLITKECNFREIESLSSTFLTLPSIPDLSESLANMLSLTEAELRDRGQEGKRFARANYAWSLVGSKMADIYDWILGGPLPSSVEIR